MIELENCEIIIENKMLGEFFMGMNWLDFMRVKKWGIFYEGELTWFHEGEEMGIFVNYECEKNTKWMMELENCDIDLTS